MFFLLALAILMASTSSLIANASAIPFPVNDGDVTSESQLLTWLSTTDAKLTYIGVPIGGPRALTDVMVVYCNRRVGGVCGGSCTVYNGPNTCLRAPGTKCLKASVNVGFCNTFGCNGDCNDSDTCGVRLDDGFCYTPGTAAILVPYVG